MEKQRENQIEQDELFRFWFAGLKGIGNREKIQLTKEFPQKKTLYYIEETALKKRLKEKWTEGKAETITQIIQEGKRRWSKEIVAEWQKKGIALVTYEQEKYPDRLRNISSPPYALYVMGKLPEKGRRTAAIVGARNCTYYGETYARKIGKILSEAGISVISGMARGIDAAGQRGAIHGSGGTFGILGSGVDICYPKENRGLYEDLKKYGGILSEQQPGSPPLAQYFPARNRLISGLADVVIIIEARERSGSLITADMALEQGKDVYVVPGRITDRLSDGCNRLLTQGAGVFLSPENFTEEFLRNWEEKQELSSPDPAQKIRGRRKSRKRIEKLEEPLCQVYKLLDCVPKSTEIILQEAWKKGEYIDIVTLHRRLMELELMGYVKQNTPGYFGTSAN